MHIQINKLLDEFKPIHLEDMSNFSLLKRVDSKFVLHKNDLQKILLDFTDLYRVLEINNSKIQSYNSQYFDTEKNKFYLDHHNGKLNRTKIRIRKYMESNDCFLEIKQKNSKGVTNKTRIPINDIKAHLSHEQLNFIEEVLQQKLILLPTLSNSFDRLTLVNTDTKERMTIDMNLELVFEGKKKTFENLVIIELKQERLNRSSIVFKVLNKIAIKPYRISKYCIGMAKLNKKVKNNSFKRKLIKLKKIEKRYGVS